MACGTPVIAFRQGGALDTVADGVTGRFFGDQTSQSLREAVTAFAPSRFNRRVIREHALRYDASRFKARFAEYVWTCYERYRRDLSSTAARLPSWEEELKRTAAAVTA
jgi:glycosyltransferase involved in cell wall biosynthesis